MGRDAASLPCAACQPFRHLGRASGGDARRVARRGDPYRGGHAGRGGFQAFDFGDDISLKDRQILRQLCQLTGDDE